MKDTNPVISSGKHPANRAKSGRNLAVGEIPYLNMLPIFTALKKHFDTTGISFYMGHPSELNTKLRDRTVDISPSSSIEYAKNHENYFIVPDISISSLRKVKSVLLFSPFDVEKENGFKIFSTSHSDTSTYLLKITLREFMGKKRKRYKDNEPG